MDVAGQYPISVLIKNVADCNWSGIFLAALLSSLFHVFHIKADMHIILGFRDCSHYAKFSLICQKICQPEAISSANDFLQALKFLQVHRNFKDSVD